MELKLHTKYLLGAADLCHCHGSRNLVCGWRIITTVASNIMKIRPINGVAADISGAFIIFGASFLHIPIITTTLYPLLLWE